MRAEVVANQETSPSYYRMGLACSELKAEYEPGQFFMLRIGQGYEPLLRRPFSIYWMEEGYLEILYRVVGRGTELLAFQRPGQKIELLGPLGKGFSIPDDWNSAILVAGGMGVAPLHALAARLSSRSQGSGFAGHPPGQGTKIYIIIGGKRQEDILCREEIQYPGSEVLITTEDGSLGEKGLATHPLAELLSGFQSRQASPSIIYACGPRPMLAKVAQISSRADIPCQVSLEEYMACGIGACMGCAVKTKTRADSYQLVCKDGPVFDAGVIQW